MKQPQPRNWQPPETAPTGKPVWLILKWNSTRYERIATHIAGNTEDPRQWDFESKQVNMSVLNKLGQFTTFGEHHTAKVIAWRDLDHDKQEDPANLGRKRRTPEEKKPEPFKTTLF